MASNNGESGKKLFEDAEEILSSSTNFETAYPLLEKAMELGYPGAKYAIGTWLLHGRFLEKNEKEGLELIQKAADDGWPDANFDFARACEVGEFVEKSESRAFGYYLRAAALGEKQSIHEVGRCLYYGIGVKKNSIAAHCVLDLVEELGVSE